MQLTRQQIIDYLEANRTATSKEMGRALQVTTANIRHHLKFLLEENLVEVVGKRPGRGRGRPKLLYSLTENARKDNLQGLASALLNTFRPFSSAEQLDELAIEILGDFEPAIPLRARLDQTVERLEQLQYQAAWEASADGPRLILRNCPYMVLLADHEILCQLDAAILGRLLGQPVQQTAKLERQPHGAPHCVFLVRMK